MLKQISFGNASCDFKIFIKVSLVLASLIFNCACGIKYNNKYAGYDDPENDYIDLDDNNYALDLAIKLKEAYADDLVSDLFATSYGLEKVARVAGLDQEDNLFHFKLVNPLLDTENMEQDEIPKEEAHVRRRKRHVYNKVEELRLDDRVEYVLPQKYLKREKRDNTEDTNELFREIEEIMGEELEVEPRKNIKSTNGFDVILEQRLEELANELENERKFKRKNMQEHLAEEFLKQLDLDAISGPILDNEIDFNDKNFKQEWYLINDGQLHIPDTHDLNVKQAWLKGFTGKNISIVIIDDGIDHEHPDFEGKYVNDFFWLF
jgi:subtilisin family serine protease